MARSRFVKPEFFGDVVLSEVSRDARLLYIGLWGLMDRRGLMEYHPKLVKRDLLPYDDDATVAQVEKWIAELVQIGRLRPIEHGGKRYIHAPNMPKHQNFHIGEKANRLIPDEVIRPVQSGADPGSAPGKHGAGTGQAPGKHGACTTTSTSTSTSTSNTADTEAGNSRHGETPPPPLPTEFQDLGIDELIRTTAPAALDAWKKIYGVELLRRELPRCWAGWLASPERQERGDRGLFVARWLENCHKSLTEKAGRGNSQSAIDAWVAGGR